MPVEGTTASGPELLIELRAGRGRPLRAQLEEGLRDAVRSGRLLAGSPLPSSRALARDLGVSRRLVVDAFSQLVAEGYLVTRQGSGTFVAETAAAAPAPVPAPLPRPPRYDFFPGSPDLSAFPRAAWARAVRDVLREAPDHALSYGDPRGTPALRTALAGYLARARGVVAQPERMVVTGGAVQALALLARVLTARGMARIAVEDPSLPEHRAVLAHQGADVVPVPVDDEGVRVDALQRTRAVAVVVTAAHQMPLGVALSVDRRAALLSWGGLVIEDDYDAEFRYDRPPLAALQGLAPEQVAYLGSASKTLAPGLRLGWLVLPADLVDDVAAEKRLNDMGNDVIGQLAFAHLITSGAYDRHLRVLRRRHRARRDAAVAAIERHLPDAQVLGIAAGLHANILLAEPIDVRAFEAACEARSVRVYGSRRRMIVLGYANLPEPTIEEGVRLLAQAVSDARQTIRRTHRSPSEASLPRGPRVSGRRA
jgi:GntR family transcriptional regulator/MocR family aminotransferase